MNLRELAYSTIVADPGCEPEFLTDACKVILLLERRPLFGQYDDRATLITPDGETSFRANTDPSRTGWNKGVGKFYAQLTPGVWVTRTGPHRGRPNHFRQPSEQDAQRLGLDRYFKPGDPRAKGHYTVKRVEKDLSGKLETGYYAINGHSGSDTSTSSWGCWTFDPDDWIKFQPLAYAALGKHHQMFPVGFMPIVLVEAA